jgi:hypothetical protein
MNISIGLTTRIIRRPDLLEQNIDSDVVLLHPEKEEYYGLQQSSARIWELIAEPTACETIIAKLVEEFEGDPAIIEADVLAFLNHMLREDLIKLADA